MIPGQLRYKFISHYDATKWHSGACYDNIKIKGLTRAFQQTRIRIGSSSLFQNTRSADYPRERTIMTPLIHIVAGIFLLAGGRKFFWFFVGAIGFITGLTFADQILTINSPAITLAAGIILGIIGIFIAVFMQRFAIFVAGFLAGSYIAYMAVTSFGLIPQGVFWITYIAGGIAGAVLLFFLFDWVLIALSSIIGALIIINAFTLDPGIEMAIVIVLTLSGIVIQTKFFSRGKS